MSLFEIKFKILWVYHNIKDYFKSLCLPKESKGNKDEQDDYHRKL